MTHPGATLSDKHRVVIIGSGFGGLNAAQKLKRADVDIKLIAKTTHHLFQPLLYQVATGIISEGEIAPPTRVILRNQKNCQVLLGEVTDIDLTNRTIDSLLLGHSYRTPYDTLIVAAGAGQSYFGNDHFAEWAPGMKTIDDALELRGRILGAFEQAERSSDPERRAKLLTFVVVGAGPTGVEMAGQIAELADYTLRGAFRHIDSTKARVILLDAAPAVLPPMGEKLGLKAAARLEKLGVEIQLGAMVTDVDRNGITVKRNDGSTERIECATKVWSAGVAASRLGKILADQLGLDKKDVHVPRAKELAGRANATPGPALGPDAPLKRPTAKTPMPKAYRVEQPNPVARAAKNQQAAKFVGGKPGAKPVGAKPVSAKPAGTKSKKPHADRRR